ncbi:rCG23628 [Rattus norvegicus]|uniref:RCG23628 n=1 Tax=Rattus norvegicus TaxID=10116 RepID=A6KUW3_RAT|nr:rCG23628 [Rattus norvegicus]
MNFIKSWIFISMMIGTTGWMSNCQYFIPNMR